MPSSLSDPVYHAPRLSGEGEISFSWEQQRVGQNGKDRSRIKRHGAAWNGQHDLPQASHIISDGWMPVCGMCLDDLFL